MSEPPEILGWKPPMLYDVGADEWRIATQEDVDRMREAVQALGTFYENVREQMRTLQAKMNWQQRP